MTRSRATSAKDRGLLHPIEGNRDLNPMSHGAGARRLVHRDLLGRSYRPFRGLALSLRRRGPKRALAAADDAPGEDRVLRLDRTAGRLSDIGRHDDDVSQGGQLVGPNGQKKWICNSTFSEINVICARDETSGQVKGFVV
jgi:hypothetical protein